MRGARVYKPRPLLWEWLLLGQTSPLLHLLDDLGGELGEGAFAFLPRLAFFQPETLDREGEVERIELAPLGGLSAADQLALSAIVGRAIALFSWLGLADLHWENLVLGRDRLGHIVFAPVDVEMILADLAAPTETKLLPDADPEYAAMCRHAAGVRRVLPYLGKPVAGAHVATIASAYRATLAFLGRHDRAIAAVLSALPALRTTPIRICLRGTADYTCPPEAAWPPFLPAELEQLSRGDIPYFFHLYGRRGVHYFANAACTSLGHLPPVPGEAKTNPVLPLSRNLRTPSRTSLAEQGLFLLLAAFDSKAIEGHHRGGDLELRVTKRRFELRFDDGETLDARRDLSTFVSSVYLPCTCGETRGVFAAPQRCDG